MQLNNKCTGSKTTGWLSCVQPTGGLDDLCLQSQVIMCNSAYIEILSTLWKWRGLHQSQRAAPVMAEMSYDYFHIQETVIRVFPGLRLFFLDTVLCNDVTFFLYIAANVPGQFCGNKSICRLTGQILNYFISVQRRHQMYWNWQFYVLNKGLQMLQLDAPFSSGTVNWLSTIKPLSIFTLNPA